MMILTCAIPTGRIFQETAARFARSGIELPAEALDRRQLRFSTGAEVDFLLAKDRDVATYVEYGVADLGVVGRDLLLELSPEVYQPLELGIGRCRMAVAGREGAKSHRQLPLVRVATKYPRITTDYFHGCGIPIELIPLSGSVELAPLLGLADCIVDVVQTGKTLEANGLSVEAVLFESSAMVAVNRASFRLKRAPIQQLLSRLRGGSSD